MLHKIGRCLAGVGKLWTTVASGFFTAIGGVQQYANIASIPAWVWWLAAIIALLATAIRIQWHLLDEQDKNRKPHPDMSFEAVIKRIRGKEDIFGPNYSESSEITKAFRQIEEYALTGQLVVFGVPGIRHIPKENIDSIVKRMPIPKDSWETHSIDYTAFLQDHSGRVAPDIPQKDGFGTGWAYIWFDEKQIDSIWPRPRKRIDWHNPLRFTDAA